MSEEVVQWGPREKRYSLLSGLNLGFLIASPFISYYYLIDSTVPSIRAAGLLLPLFALAGWIFTTIRALHMRALRFWQLPSTYVSFAGQIIAIALLCLVSFAMDGKHVPWSDYSAYWAAVFVFCGTSLWCLYYNSRRAESFFIGFNLTLVQALMAFAVVGFIFTRNYKQESDG